MASVLVDEVKHLFQLPRELLSEILEKLDTLDSLFVARQVSRGMLAAVSNIRSVPRTRFLFDFGDVNSLQNLINIFPNISTLFLRLDHWEDPLPDEAKQVEALTPYCSGIRVAWSDPKLHLDYFLQKVSDKRSFANVRAIDFSGFDVDSFATKAANIGPPPLLSSIRIFDAPPCDVFKLPDSWTQQLRQITILFEGLGGENFDVDLRAATNLRGLNINLELGNRPSLLLKSQSLDKLELWQMKSPSEEAETVQGPDGFWHRRLGKESNIFSRDAGNNPLATITNLCIWNYNVKFDLSAISWMTQLERLTVNPCRLSKRVSDLSKLTKLSKLCFKTITGSKESKEMLLDAIHKLPSLETLMLDGIVKIRLDGSRFASASRLRRLHSSNLAPGFLQQLAASFTALDSLKMACDAECFRSDAAVLTVRTVHLSAPSNGFEPSYLAKVFPNTEKLVFYFDPLTGWTSTEEFFNQLRDFGLSRLSEVVITDRLFVYDGKVLEREIKLPSHTKRFSFV
eukprot:TRINITY_DN9885_c0_g1_i1.p1 TRINITY_DN9885_c0_g1~~TRINITY_DN9885_c0_g1_i1.p1  ORF type:complete len:547 (+),score=47.81 TRINITY_DN9885_c0_g1_i1:108-1643(+)